MGVAAALAAKSGGSGRQTRGGRGGGRGQQKVHSRVASKHALTLGKPCERPKGFLGSTAHPGIPVDKISFFDEAVVPDKDDPDKTYAFSCRTPSHGIRRGWAAARITQPRSDAPTRLSCTAAPATVLLHRPARGLGVLGGLSGCAHRSPHGYR